MSTNLKQPMNVPLSLWNRNLFLTERMKKTKENGKEQRVNVHMNCRQTYYNFLQIFTFANVTKKKFTYNNLKHSWFFIIKVHLRPFDRVINVWKVARRPWIPWTFEKKAKNTPTESNNYDVIFDILITRIFRRKWKFSHVSQLHFLILSAYFSTFWSIYKILQCEVIMSFNQNH